MSNVVTQKVNEALGKLFEVIYQALKIIDNMPWDKYRLGGEKAGKNGWTIPFFFTLKDIEAIVDADINSKELDSFFIEEYTKDNGERFEQLINSIYKTEQLGNWSEAFNQCINAYKQNHYLITIPLLIIIIEGLLSKLNDNKNSLKIISVCKRMFEETQAKDPVDGVIWLSTLRFIENIYNKSDFSSDEPNRINRHWILHGRTAMNWGIADSLRLFNAVATLTELLSH